MALVTSGSNSGISKKSLYKPALKERIKAKCTNRKPLAQSQLVDLNNPRSAKICKNGMKSLLTRERNFLSPDVQRRETICTPGKASLSCRQYDAEVEDKLSETMNEKENRNKEDLVAKVICHAQCSAKKKLLGNQSRFNLQEKSSCNCLGYRNKIQFFFLQQRCKYNPANRYECHMASFWF